MKKILIILLCILVVPIIVSAQDVKSDSLIAVISLENKTLSLAKTAEGKFSVSVEDADKGKLLILEEAKKAIAISPKEVPTIKPCFDLWRKVFALSFDKVTLYKMRYKRMDVKMILDREGKVKAINYLLPDTSAWHEITPQGFLKFDEAVFKQISYQICWPASNKQQYTFYTEPLSCRTLLGEDMLLDSLSCVKIKGRELFSGRMVFPFSRKSYSSFNPIYTFFRDESHFRANAMIENVKAGYGGYEYNPVASAPKLLWKKVLISSFSKETLKKVGQGRDYIFIVYLVNSKGRIKYVKFSCSSEEVWKSIPPLEFYKLQQAIRKHIRCKIGEYKHQAIPFPYIETRMRFRFSDILNGKSPFWEPSEWDKLFSGKGKKKHDIVHSIKTDYFPAQNVNPDSLITAISLENRTLSLAKAGNGNFLVSVKGVDKGQLLIVQEVKIPITMPKKEVPTMKPCLELWSKAFASSLDKVTLNKIRYCKMNIKMVLNREGKVEALSYLLPDTSIWHKITSQDFLKLTKAIYNQISYQIHWPSSNKQQYTFYTQPLNFWSLFGDDMLLDSLRCVKIKGRELFSGKRASRFVTIWTFFRDESLFEKNAMIENAKAGYSRYDYYPGAVAPKQLWKKVLISSFSKETLKKVSQNAGSISIRYFVNPKGRVKCAKFSCSSEEVWRDIPPLELFKLQQAIRKHLRCKIHKYAQQKVPFPYIRASQLFYFSDILNENSPFWEPSKWERRFFNE
ncbi:MAG: hypothetical protein WCQ86_07760 [Bacteroidaceae bacterium]